MFTELPLERRTRPSLGAAPRAGPRAARPGSQALAFEACHGSKNEDVDTDIDLDMDIDIDRNVDIDLDVFTEL